MWRKIDPASGGYTWFIRQGNYITLAELFWHYQNTLTCFDLYRFYVSLPIWIHKRLHSMSHTESGTKRRNAEKLNYLEHGFSGLPSAGWRK